MNTESLVQLMARLDKHHDLMGGSESGLDSQCDFFADYPRISQAVAALVAFARTTCTCEQLPFEQTMLCETCELLARLDQEEP